MSVVLSYLTLWVQRSSSASWRGPLGASGLQPAGQVLSPIYRAGRRDVPRDPLVPGLLVLANRLPLATASRGRAVATECERGRDLSALAGTSNAEYGRGDGLGSCRAQARRSSNLVCAASEEGDQRTMSPGSRKSASRALAAGCAVRYRGTSHLGHVQRRSSARLLVGADRARPSREPLLGHAGEVAAARWVALQAPAAPSRMVGTSAPYVAASPTRSRAGGGPGGQPQTAFQAGCGPLAPPVRTVDAGPVMECPHAG
jgi:hypothetical protein